MCLFLLLWWNWDVASPTTWEFHSLCCSSHQEVIFWPLFCLHCLLVKCFLRGCVPDLCCVIYMARTSRQDYDLYVIYIGVILQLDWLIVWPLILTLANHIDIGRFCIWGGSYTFWKSVRRTRGMRIFLHTLHVVAPCIQLHSTPIRYLTQTSD